MIAGIHFQYINDSGEMMKRILDSEKPFFAYIVPALLDKSLTISSEPILSRNYSEKNYYPKWLVDTFKENKDNPNISFVQEGYLHYCERCFDKFEKNKKEKGRGFPDPFHEHCCLDGRAQSLEKQKESIEKGKNLIKSILEIEPKIYCPPNHLFNEDTMHACRKLNFEYIVVRNVLGISPYVSNLIGFLPESKLGERKSSPIVYTYYDHLVNGKWEDFLPYLENPSEKVDFSSPNLGNFLNSKAVILAKKFRDVKNKYF